MPNCNKFTDKMFWRRSNPFIFTTQNFPLSIPDASEHKEVNSLNWRTYTNSTSHLTISAVD